MVGHVYACPRHRAWPLLLEELSQSVARGCGPGKAGSCLILYLLGNTQLSFKKMARSFPLTD